jgi:S1-C subfamily serine protease
VIPRSALDLALEHLPHVLGGVRVVPTGNPPSLVLADVQSDGLAWRLGMRSGDVVLSVMGRTVSSTGCETIAG